MTDSTDAERLAETLFLRRSIVTQSDLIKRLTQERDAATRRAEVAEADVGRLREQISQEQDNADAWATDALAAPSAADHTERARELFLTWMKTRPADTYQSSIMSSEATRLIVRIADTLAAAERAGAEKMRERAARRCEADAHTNTPDERRGYLAAGEPIKAAAWEAKWLAQQVRALPLPGEE